MNTQNTNIIDYAPEAGRLTSGQVCLANESRFDHAHLSEPLTAYATGWKDPENLRALLDFIAPPVPVSRRFEFRKADNAEAFLTEAADERAIGAAFKRVAYSGTVVNAKTYNKGLTIRIDRDEEPGPDWKERIVQMLIQRLLRNEVRRALTALESAATNDGKTWNSSSNPDADIRSALATATTASGLRPNRILFGEAAWDTRASAYDAQNNAAAMRSAGMTPEELARKVFVDGVRVAHARYQSSASQKTALVGNMVYLFTAYDGLMKDEPSNIKRFMTPTEAGPFRVYVEETAKYTDISVEHYSAIVVTSTLGLRKITVS